MAGSPAEGSSLTEEGNPEPGEGEGEAEIASQGERGVEPTTGTDSSAP